MFDFHMSRAYRNNGQLQYSTKCGASDLLQKDFPASLCRTESLCLQPATRLSSNFDGFWEVSQPQHPCPDKLPPLYRHP